MTSLATATASRSWRKETAGEYTFNDLNELYAFLQHELQVSKLKYNALAVKSDMCASTVSKMAHGTTLYPRAATVFNLLKVLGYEMVVRG